MTFVLDPAQYQQTSPPVAPRPVAAPDVPRTRRIRRIARHVRTGVHRLRGVRRPGELRDQHVRRRPLRVPAAVGHRRRQRPGDVRPGPVRQARHRHRAYPARAVPRPPAAPADLDAVGPGRAGGRRHRPGRVRRRGDRAQPAVRCRPAARGGDHRGRLVRAADAGAPRTPRVRGGDRGHAGDRPGRVPVPGAAGRVVRRGRGRARPAPHAARTASCSRRASSAPP